MAVFDDGLDWSEKVKLYPHKVNWVDGIPQPEKAEFESIHLEPEEPLRQECNHFLESIKNNTKPRTDGLEGLNVLKVLDASQESLTNGVTVHLEKDNTVNEKNIMLMKLHALMKDAA